jgi:putative peptidoglycan lipid II flippase
MSSLLGWVRNVVLASLFGATAATDAFLLANLIPSIIFSAINGGFNATVVPVFSDVKQKSGEGHAWGFVIALSLVYLVCAGFLALLGIAIASNLISLIAPTLPEAVELLASKLLRILFPTVALFGIALIGSNALGRLHFRVVYST